MLKFIYGGVLQVGGNPNLYRMIQTTNESGCWKSMAPIIVPTILNLACWIKQELRRSHVGTHCCDLTMFQRCVR